MGREMPVAKVGPPASLEAICSSVGEALALGTKQLHRHKIEQRQAQPSIT
jgi:hypothetical protein